MNEPFRTIRECVDSLEKEEVSAVEVVEFYLKRIQAQKHLGAFLDTFMESAIAEAEDVDSRRDSGALGVLAGVPLAIKDNILIQGHPATAASHILTGFVSPYDATVTRKLRESHAVFLGRTNMDEFAMGSSTENSAWQVTHNPHDASRVPGGSSGGSASAVAAHLCLGALGSDTGGSVRQPASFCGVVGLKPTYGAVSRHGLIAMASSLDQIGVLANTIEDTKAIFDVIRGRDEFDSTSQGLEIRNSKFEIRNLKVGLPKEYLAQGLDPDVKEKVLKAAEKFEKAGAKVEEVSLSSTPYGLPCYYVIMPAEASTNLARYDGMRFGYSALGDTLEEVYVNSRSEGFGDEVRRRIILGTFVLSSGYKEAYYRRANQVRTLIRRDFESVFERVDIVLTPTAPTPAFKLGDKIQDPLSMYLADIYTVNASLAGIPAISVPGGNVLREECELPVGVQLMASWWREELLFQAGKVLESV